MEDVDPDVPLEHLERVLVEQHRLPLAGPLQLRTNGRIQRAAELDRLNFSVGNRVASPWPMIDAIASTRFDFSDRARGTRARRCHERPELAVADPSHSLM